MNRIPIIIILIVVIKSISFTEQTTIRHYLSGKDKDHTVAWDFYCTRVSNSGKWSKIPVQPCWELQGFGSYHYGGEEDVKQNETGVL